jgi:hypothetical protein
VTGPLCPHCGQPGHYVNGHYECPVVRGFVFEGCCGGEVADGLPGGAADDLPYRSIDLTSAQNVRPCICGGLPKNIMFCAICGTANICESEPDVDDVVKAA